MSDKPDTPAHSMSVAHKYIVHYPPHPARENDPNYKDFHHYHETTKNDPEIYKCWIGKKHGEDYSECTLDKPLELHHSHIEFSMQNGVDLALLEADYPGVSDAESVGAWVESAENLIWLCQWHHRGAAGAHTAAYSDWEASKYIKNLIAKGQKNV